MSEPQSEATQEREAGKTKILGMSLVGMSSSMAENLQAIDDQNLIQHGDCHATNLQTGDTMVYDEELEGWVNKPLSAGSDVDGGTF